MGKFPSESFSINSSWLVVSLLAQDLPEKNGSSLCPGCSL